MSEPKKPTAKDVTVSLYWSLRSASQILVPRYTPLDWWECDMWRLTKADFVDEYEIKMSVADFRADAHKADIGYDVDPLTRRFVRRPPATKHSFLATDQKGPNRFWFVMPDDLADKVEIPPWAGLMVFRPFNHPTIRKQAPKRHARKWEGNKVRLFETFYHRFWSHEASAKTEIAPSDEFTNLLDETDAD